ncbi:glycosyltransferase family 4 protein [Asticcacaulis benevestitus]|nr:glycosyltransferase family 1 protein [Asticcacaulis benevestitus]
MHRIVFNGKFQGQKATGVQRVAHALISGVIARKRSGDPLLAGLDLAMASPKGVTSHLDLENLVGKHLKGIPWEQFELPAMAGKGLLVNLGNVGPVSRTGDVLMIHDAQIFITPESYSKAFRVWYKTILPILAHKASRILTVSEYARSCLAEAGIAPLERIEVLHNGVDHIKNVTSDPLILSTLGLINRPYLVGMSSVQHHKDVRTIIRAADIMKNRDVPLVLIGSATEADFKAAGIDLGSNIILAGRLRDEEMRAVIEGARAFAFPSLTEGFGLPPLEAMLLGTPAIVAPKGALPELCGDDAMSAEASNPEAWAAAIDKLVEDNDLRAHYSIAGQHRAANYSWSAASEHLARILHDAA